MNIVDAYNKAVEKVLGFTEKKKQKQRNHKTLRRTKTLNKLLDTENNQDKRTVIRKERNKINEMHKILAEEKHGKILEQIKNIERQRFL